MFGSEKFVKIGNALLMLIAFVLPLNKKVIPLLIILFVISWILSGNLKERTKNITRPKFLLLFISFYLLHVIGMLYTSNTGFGMFDLEIKLSFLLFPLVLATFPTLSRNAMNHLMLSLIGGCFVACIANLWIGYGRYVESGDINDMLYGELSHFHHPTYFSMYLGLAIVMILNSLLNPEKYATRVPKWILAVLVPFFILMIVILMAKAGVFMVALIILAAIVYMIFTRRYMYVFLLSAFAVLGVSTALYFIPDAFKRIESTWVVATQSIEDRDLTTIESTAGRILVWEQAVGLIGDNWIFGVGTGDVKDELIARYAENGLTGIVEKRLNAHNQSLTDLIALPVKPDSLIARELTTWGKARRLLGSGAHDTQTIQRLAPIAACRLLANPRAFAHVYSNGDDGDGSENKD